MAANIEVKANLQHPARQFQLAESIAGISPQRLVQRDTFFHSPSGRLKLREIEGETAQLIQYFRDDDPELRKSDYIITPVDEPESMKIALERSMGIRGVVAKVRSLWIVGQTRIHFDTVEDLGDFVELEFVLQANQPESEGHDFAADLMQKLEIRPNDVIQCAYIDLLEQPNSLQN
jgi:predicted adenylyl cyclase CyaB